MRLRAVRGGLRHESDEFVWLLIGQSCRSDPSSNPAGLVAKLPLRPAYETLVDSTGQPTAVNNSALCLVPHTAEQVSPDLLPE